MVSSSKFETLVNRMPVDNDKLIGQAVSWFISQQDPDKVEFTKYKNGYHVKVYTDEKNAQGAAEFWNENVNPHLGDDK